jgi:putative transposase
MSERALVLTLHARSVIEHWRVEYNIERPHSSLGNRTPPEFVKALATAWEKRVSLTEDSTADSY